MSQILSDDLMVLQRISEPSSPHFTYTIEDVKDSLDFVKRSGDIVTGTLTLTNVTLSDSLVIVQGDLLSSRISGNISVSDKPIGFTISEEVGNIVEYFRKNVSSLDERENVMTITSDGEVIVQTPDGVDSGYVKNDNQLVNKAYVDDENDLQYDVLDQHQSALNTLEFKVDAISGVQVGGLYRNTRITSCENSYNTCLGDPSNDPDDCLASLRTCQMNNNSPGDFTVYQLDDDFRNIEYFYINKKSTDATEIDWKTNFTTNDFIEVTSNNNGVQDKTNYALFKILDPIIEKSFSSGEANYEVHVQFLQGIGSLSNGSTFDVVGVASQQGISPDDLGDFVTKDFADVTYAPKVHYHDGSAITTGTINTNRLNVGTGSNQVAAGNHQHGNSYASVNHKHQELHSPGGTVKFSALDNGCKFHGAFHMKNGVGDDSRILTSKGSGEIPAWGVRIWTNNGRLYWGE
jgi:hypothetical protein